MRFIDVRLEVWLIILFSYLSFVAGILTIYYAIKMLPNKSHIEFEQTKIEVLNKNGVYLKYTLAIFTIIGLIVAIQHWVVLINKFGSIANVLISANLIYRMRVEGEIAGTIPYLNAFSYAGVFLGAFYTAIKGRLSLLAILPFVAVIIQDMASVGRAGIFLAFLVFILTFFLLRHYLHGNSMFKLKKTSFVIAGIILLTLFIGSTTLIKTARGSIEKFKASTNTLNELSRSNIISPSIYLYFSSNIGVLSRYFEMGGEDKMTGENTFLPFYNLASKFNVVEHPGFYPKGYFIPMWTNSATYLRDLHEDFGYSGLFLIPFLLGLSTTYFWIRFYTFGKVFDFIILVYLSLIVSFSTFYMITRAAVYILSLIILLITLIYLFRKISSHYNFQLNET